MSVPERIADRLLAECIGRPQAHAELGWLCDHVGGRTSGAESGRRAEEWSHALFTRWGLESVRYEEQPLIAWTRGSIDAQVLEPAAWRLTAMAHGNAPASADVTAPVADVGHGEGDQFAAAPVRGCIALCDEGATEGRRKLHRTEKLKFAVEHGAAGLMILSSAPGGLPRTGVCWHGEAPVPSLGISKEDGERLRRLIAAGGKPMVRIRTQNSFAPGVGRSVLADLPGRELREEVVLLGAHLDCWDVAQGATDNGLGVAIVLEAARALAALPERPRRTVRFALWTAEETGLWGSKHYAEQHAAELKSIAAVMNFDMTGPPEGFLTPGFAEPGELLEALAKQLAPLGMKGRDEQKAQLHSDHQPFMLAGVPIVGFTWDSAKLPGAYFYHSVGDTFEKVDLADFARTAACAALTAWALADAPERPFPHKSPTEVRAMIDAAELYEALLAEQYDGPPMHVGPA